MVFALLALERGVPNAHLLLSTVVVTVGMSVFLHGLTSVPLVARYHRWYMAQAVAEPTVPEAKPTRVPRNRRQAGPDERAGQVAAATGTSG